jgi:hypothetical protein
MTNHPKSLRRVVTGHDADGKSCVIFDSHAPNLYQRPGTQAFFTMFWTIDRVPAALSGNRDEGSADRKFSHSPPATGANFRIVQSLPETERFKDHEAEQESFDRMNPGGLSELKVEGPAGHFHRTPSVDYAFNLGCDRYLVLDDSEVLMRRGDVVIQLGNYHAWVNRSNEPGCMAFDMIGGEFPD